MGEIAEMMLDGTMCQACGEWMYEGSDGPGYPQTCAGCGGTEDDLHIPYIAINKVKCLGCNKLFREQAHMEQHKRAVHDKKQ